MNQDICSISKCISTRQHKTFSLFPNKHRPQENQCDISPPQGDAGYATAGSQRLTSGVETEALGFCSAAY